MALEGRIWSIGDGAPCHFAIKIVWNASDLRDENEVK